MDQRRKKSQMRHTALRVRIGDGKIVTRFHGTQRGARTSQPVQLDNTMVTKGGLPPPGWNPNGGNARHPDNPTGINDTTNTMQGPSSRVAGLHRNR